MGRVSLSGCLAVLFHASVFLACGEMSPSTDSDVPGGTGDLTIGSRGTAVRTVHEYLGKFGYFPNERLARDYPAWRPIVPETPKDHESFDQQTAAAVRHVQALAKLPQTGVVDVATWAFLSTPRCGVPDGISPADTSWKYDIDAKPPNSRKWWLTNGSTPARRAALAAAFSTWQSVTTLFFTEDPSADPGIGDILIDFQSIDGPNNTLASTSSFRNFITFDTDEPWSTTIPTPPFSIDFQTTALHEIGHAMGLAHSGLGPTNAATMYPTWQGTDRTLDLDDIVAISVNYDQYVTDIGTAQRISGSWKIGFTPTAGGYQIYKFNLSSHSWNLCAGTGATRIAVDPVGRPWIIDSSNQIFRRTTNSPFSGTWAPMPGFAKEIAVGRDGTIDGSVYVVGVGAFGDGYGIWKFNGTGWDPTDGGGVRIAVDAYGKPWTVTASGNIFRYTSAVPLTGSWDSLPLPFGLLEGLPEISIRDRDFAWLAYHSSFPPFGGDVAVYVWNEQFGVPGSDVDALERWLLGGHFNGAGSNLAISAEANLTPQIVTGNGTIHYSVK